MSQPNKTRVLSIDYGLARIGMALSDESHLLASPLENLASEKKLDNTLIATLNRISQLEEQHRCTICKIVVGLPLMLSGKQGMMADEVLEFVEKLTAQFPGEVVTWDERLTSVQADRSLREFGLNRKKRAKKVDSVTAVIILQNYLDSQCGQGMF